MRSSSFGTISPARTPTSPPRASSGWRRDRRSDRKATFPARPDLQAERPLALRNPSPAQRRYRWRDLQRLCAAEGLALRLPSSYPRNGLLAARAALIAVDEGWRPELTRAIYHANFAVDRDIADAAVIRAGPGCGRRARRQRPTRRVSLRAAKRRSPAAFLARRASLSARSCSGIMTGSTRLSPGRSCRPTCRRLDEALLWADRRSSIERKSIIRSLRVGRGPMRRGAARAATDRTRQTRAEER